MVDRDETPGGIVTERVDLDQIKALEAAATPGPWHWGGNVDIQLMRLYTRENLGQTVMDFARWGMRDAAPRFCGSDHLMHRADERVRFSVCHEATDRSDRRVYRGDFDAVSHPDAEFIAAARSVVPALVAEVEQLRAEVDDLRAKLDNAGRAMAIMQNHEIRADAAEAKLAKIAATLDSAEAYPPHGWSADEVLAWAIGIVRNDLAASSAPGPEADRG